MVSVLLSRLHPDAQRIDGKGGDGGRDVQIVSGKDSQVTDAFQLKSFTGRMTPGRKKQVERSLDRAAGLGPAQWILIVPIDPTPDELKWFHQLGTGYSFPTRWYGRTWLDEKMSEFPDIRRYFVEGAEAEVVRLLLELQKEQAMVTDVPDAVGRFLTLRERLNEIDPHYRYEITTGAVTVERWPSDVVFSVRFVDMRVDVYPKYRGAVEDRPVSINLMVVVGPDDEVVLNALDYGLEATIPDRMIRSVTIDAPSGLGANFTGGELVLSPINTILDDPVTLALDIMDGGKLVSSCPVHITEQTGGPRGFIFTGTDRTGWLETRVTVDVIDEELKAEFWLNPEPAMPAALLPLFRWIDAYRPPHDLKIRWPEGFEAMSEIISPFWGDESLSRVVRAFAYLQDSSGKFWDMPPSLSNEEGREIVAAAALLKGESIDLRWKSFDVSLSLWGPELKELVEGRPQSFIFEQEIALNLQGVEIFVGRVRTYAPSARLADPGSVQQALASGLVPRLRLIPGDSDKAQRVLVPEPR